MIDIGLVIIALLLTLWVVWLEHKVANLSDEVDTLRNTVVGLVRGYLVATCKGDKITIKPTTEV